MSANIFSQRLHRYVNAKSKSIKINSCGPRIIQGHQRSMLVSGFGNCRNVLHLHRDGTRTFTPDQARIRAQLSRKIRTCPGRIVADLYPESAQYAVREHAIGTINTLRQQNMISALEQRQMDE